MRGDMLSNVQRETDLAVFLDSECWNEEDEGE